MHTSPKQNPVALAKSALVAAIAGYDARPLPATASSADVECTIIPLGRLLDAVADLVDAQAADIADSVGGSKLDGDDFRKGLHDLASDLFADIQSAAELAQRNAREESAYHAPVMRRPALWLGARV